VERADGLRPAWTTDVWTKRAKVMGKSAERDRRARKQAVWAVVVGLILAIAACLVFRDWTPGQKRWKALKNRMGNYQQVDSGAGE
jgi:hypothetical protein